MARFEKRCGVELLPESGLQCIHGDSFSVLGTTLNLKIDDYGVNLNYETKIKEIEKLLIKRVGLSDNKHCHGKSIAKLVLLFQTLPNPTNAQLINAFIYKFILSNKSDKIARNIQRMCHIL